MNVEIYRRESDKYKPDKNRLKVVYIAESPPPFKTGEKPRYFYFSENRGNDLLFSAIVMVLYGIEYKKNPYEEMKLLKRFRDDGYFLIDACEYPLKKIDDKERHVLKNLPQLIERIKTIQNRSTNIILIKKNVFYLLNEHLREKGLNVLNERFIGFPGYYNDRKTIGEIRRLIPIKV